jgi:hypothetical protein
MIGDVAAAAPAKESAFRPEDAFQKKVADKLKPVDVDVEDKSFGAHLKRFRNAALRGMTHDIHADVKDNHDIMQMHDDAEKFDPRTETVFKVLQVRLHPSAAATIVSPDCCCSLNTDHFCLLLHLFYKCRNDCAGCCTMLLSVLVVLA